MKFGLSPLQAGGDFAATIRECEQAEAAGFDSVWLGEHHNNRALYPTPLIGLAAIAGRTRKVRLGSPRDEAVPLIQRLWSEDKVTHAGRHYRVTSATVSPRPVQRPRPPIWFGGWVEPAIRRAGRLGEAWLGGPSAKLDEVAACVRLYREARTDAGRDPDAGEVAPVVKRPAGTLTIERLAEDRIILGDPASCIRQLQRFRKELALGHLVCRVSAPGIPRDAAMSSLDLLTREVLPALA